MQQSAARDNADLFKIMQENDESALGHNESRAYEISSRRTNERPSYKTSGKVRKNKKAKARELQRASKQIQQTILLDELSQTALATAKVGGE